MNEQMNESYFVDCNHLLRWNVPQMAAEAEKKDNLAEQNRQHGKRVRYGEIVQVIARCDSWLVNYLYTSLAGPQQMALAAICLVYRIVLSSPIMPIVLSSPMPIKSIVDSFPSLSSFYNISFCIIIIIITMIISSSSSSFTSLSSSSAYHHHHHLPPLLFTIIIFSVIISVHYLGVDISVRSQISHLCTINCWE